MTTAYIVSDLKPAQTRKLLSDGEVLGPEDFELGLRVPAAHLEGEELELAKFWRSAP